MTAPASRLADVIDALVALFGGALTVPVYDGPQPQRTSARTFVMVGATDLDGEGEDGELSQADVQRSDIGNGEYLDETGHVTCLACAWSGGTGTSSPRRQALELVDACRAAVAADPDLGGTLYGGYFAEVSSVHLEQLQAQTGYRCKAIFTVTYSTLLTP